MATIGTKGCQTVRVRRVSVNKQRLLYKNSAYYEPTIRLSLSLYMCTTGKQNLKDFFRFICHYLTLISVCAHCRTFAFLTSWKREKANKTWSCCVSILILTSHLSELYQPKVKFSIQAWCIFFRLIQKKKKKFKIKAIAKEFSQVHWSIDRNIILRRAFKGKFSWQEPTMKVFSNFVTTR